MDVHSDQQHAIEAKLHNLHGKAGEIRRRLSVSRRMRYDPPTSNAGVILNIDIAEGETRQLLRTLDLLRDMLGDELNCASRAGDMTDTLDIVRPTRSLNARAEMNSIVAGMPVDVRGWFIAELQAKGSLALAQQGRKAFESPRKASAAHEAGHAVNYAASGTSVRSVKIFHRSHDGRRHWLGITLGGGAWCITPDTAPENDLAVARNQLAGVLGEFVLDARDFRAAPASTRSCWRSRSSLARPQSSALRSIRSWPRRWHV